MTFPETRAQKLKPAIASNSTGARLLLKHMLPGVSSGSFRSMSRASFQVPSSVRRSEYLCVGGRCSQSLREDDGGGHPPSASARHRPPPPVATAPEVVRLFDPTHGRSSASCPSSAHRLRSRARRVGEESVALRALARAPTRTSERELDRRGPSLRVGKAGISG